MKIIKRDKNAIDKNVLKGKGKARNGLCPCGSGKKYKKCHLNEFLFYKEKKINKERQALRAKQILSYFGKDLKKIIILKVKETRGKIPETFSIEIEFKNELGNLEFAEYRHKAILNIKRDFSNEIEFKMFKMVKI